MTNGYVYPQFEPYSPWQADIYLRVHGAAAFHAGKAAWILEQFDGYQETGDGQTYNWSQSRWLQHQRMVAA